MSRKSTRLSNIIVEPPEAEGFSKKERSLSHSRQDTRRESSKAKENIKSQKMPSRPTKIHNSKASGLPQKIGGALSIEPPAKFDSFHKIFSRLLEKIQLLNYQQPLPQLKQKFKQIVKNYVVFNDIFPKGLNLIGKELLKNGIFHEMWGKVCKKGYKDHQFANYYQLYYSQLASHHTNFQAAFNQYSFSNDLTNPYIYVIEDDDSTTRLTQKALKQPFQLSLRSQNEEPKGNKSIQENEEMIFSGRLRLTSCINSNERRLKAEIACYFLGIKQSFHLDDLEILTILEFYHQNEKQLLIVEAFVPVFNEALRKMTIKNQPKVLLAMHGYVSFAQLLRIKQQYGKIEGFILYDELRDITQWLNANFEK